MKCLPALPRSPTAWAHRRSELGDWSHLEHGYALSYRVVTKRTIEIRDPLHVFIKVAAEERPVLDSAAVQRLRHIHQLALSYLVYPAATHRRFEHSLGVMELASRIFDVVTHPDNLTDAVRGLVPTDEHRLFYWRRVLRMAALVHDTGHLPFSHAAEAELLPKGTDHETLTEAIIRSDQMETIWKSLKLVPDDIVALAVEPGEAGALPPWEAILNEIITGEVFGADRMDYLLRDSLHAGVAYGRFDHFRLIETLRILPPPRAGEGEGAQGSDPLLGVELGGIQSAEALLLARYFMFSQVYLHRTRRIYDIHLMDFLKEWLDGGRFSTKLEDHLAMTDNEVSAGFLAAARDGRARGHVHARRIVEHQHFKVLFAPTATDLKRNAAGPKQLYEAAVEKFGAENVRYDRYSKGASVNPFPVLERDGQIIDSSNASDVLARIPAASSHYVFVAREVLGEAVAWKDANVEALTAPRSEEVDDEKEA